MSTALYSEYYGLQKRPFSLLPDPDFLFWSKAHRRAYAVLEYGLMSRAPLTVITGEVGAGKTTLIQEMLSRLSEETVIGLISNAQGGKGDLLRWVLNALNITHDADEDYVSLHQKLQDFCVQCYSQGRHVVLVIDEAQNLSEEALEELRMLTNINSHKDELLQLVLVGQPELRTMIERPSLRQFAQRVAASYHIRPMDKATTKAYIIHRLKHAGGSGHEFSPSAVDRVFRETGGVPRLVNKLCDIAMVYAVGADTTFVDESIIDELIEDQVFITTRQEQTLYLTDPVDDANDSSGTAAE